MCDTCGCNVTPGNKHLVQAEGKLAKTEAGHEAIDVLQGLLTENDHRAAHNREHFDRHAVLAINLMSSPGAGKTTLLESTLGAVKDEFNIAVIEGDLETENDARRIRAQGVEAVQITTGSACHLDAYMVHDALHHMNLDGLDLLFIENVGNLVCPASFDLGQHRNVTLLSVPEGDDKPAKYPVMFRSADLVLLSKADLLPFLDDFDPGRAEQYLRQLANPAPMLQVSAGRRVHIDDWLAWLRDALLTHRVRLSEGETQRPATLSESARLRGEVAENHVHHRAVP